MSRLIGLRVVAVWTAYLFGAVLVGCTVPVDRKEAQAASTQATTSKPTQNLCARPEIANLSNAPGLCWSRQVRYREAGSEPVDATLVSVHRGMRMVSYDELNSWFWYFLALPDGRELFLGEFPAWREISASVMFEQLGYDGSKAGGTAGQTPSFADRFITKIGSKYCTVLVMRRGFTGELLDCGEPGERHGRYTIVGKAGYEPGALSQMQLGQQMCERFAAEIRVRCETNVVYLRSATFERDEAGTPQYRIVVERMTGLINQRRGRKADDFRERRTYLVSVDGKSVEEVARKWEECIRNVGCLELFEPPAGED